MPPQPQGQMMPPDSQQMAPQPQGGGQLPPEVMQILMTLPENIRQYLLSLPPDQMMMELQKIMQEQMAQQQGQQGQQGPPMPPQGGEQMAPPMMGRYGMKIKAGTGNGKLTTNPYEDALVDKRNKGIITLRNDPNANVQDKTLITTKPKTTTSTVAPIIQPTINSNQNLNIPQGNYSSVTPSEKRATQFSKDMDMMIDGYKVKLIDNNGTLGYIDPVKNVFVKLNIGQTVKAPQGANIVNSVNNSQAVISEPKVVSRNLTTTPSTVIAKSAAPKVVTTKPAQTNSSLTTKQQGITTNPTKKATPAAKPKTTNTAFEEDEKRRKEIGDKFMKGELMDPVTITAPRYLRDIVPYSPEYSDTNPNNDNTRFNSKQHELANLNNKIAILKDEEKRFLKAKRNGAGMISWKDSIEHKKITDKIDALYTERNKVEKSKKSYSAYKSGGQLPSALKVSTPLKTIMDRKIEMYKSGGKMKLKTCKHGC